ncbi:hypothetical protein RSSM_02828 [Rhodopirellula sallentina SM41]|uniref:Uncharacterized protein n=1 Tax=Rhodopirellula sallentina SM41 TaxID=1263870 RepID=M5UD16_9BACT|nr:hypothetical protein RSSM_02828 [Rhodopirellula sallentina SM41]
MWAVRNGSTHTARPTHPNRGDENNRDFSIPNVSDPTDVRRANTFCHVRG